MRDRKFKLNDFLKGKIHALRFYANWTESRIAKKLRVPYSTIHSYCYKLKNNNKPIIKSLSPSDTSSASTTEITPTTIPTLKASTPSRSTKSMQDRLRDIIMFDGGSIAY